MCTVEESSEGNSNKSCQNMIGSRSESESPNYKLWDDARCPVCLDHPHNAVLLWCSSRDKGCSPFMCDTSTRHSNCLDQFRQSTEPSLSNQSTGSWDALICPLCRGQITGWSVDDDAREYMNLKTRICSNENCEFSGNYMELRNHSRAVHPDSRPAVVDPERQEEWARLENEMGLSSLLSATMNLLEGEVIPPVDVSYDEAVMIWDYRRGRSNNGASNNFILRRDSNRERFHRNSRNQGSSRRNGGVSNLNPRQNNGFRGNNTQRMQESKFNSSANYSSSRNGSHKRGNRNGR